MSLPASRKLLYEILQYISALYRMEVITEEVKNELARLAKDGLNDRFDALYTKCLDLPDNPLRNEIMELILFQD